ncbi:MAG: bifunctional diaminohydroxyphosphoribosylaminopyrimidine deaminase/5-amino-6-(5-phosphoribosylamino)uracil reductase RibD, partial [Acetobacteraceae bacterium]|nr:bifunctional diaminohydroxyphosphoribosylaminopyrimidine deaminase/5-amino-6-(5-phosphoribosylamino)uracil reductase RibD [Acetobacteraceae bacterium]
EMAGDAAQGATAYVTLEPCSHHGQTPPCADALVAAGIRRVVIACADPYPKVNGAGIARLRAAGVEVVTGVLETEAVAQHQGFLTRVRQGRPMVTLKLASTLDGRIATRTGESQWITGPQARRFAHALRAQHDGVMVGVGTVQTDNPELTCRIPGFRRGSDLRIIADTHLRTRLMSRVVVSARDIPTWFLHGPGADPERAAALREAGARLFAVPAAEPGIDLAAGLGALADAGLTRLLVEGGAQIAGALLRAGLVDRIAWFHAPSVMGGDGWPAASAFGMGTLAAIPHFVREDSRVLGPDMLTSFRRA